MLWRTVDFLMQPTNFQVLMKKEWMKLEQNVFFSHTKVSETTRSVLSLDIFHANIFIELNILWVLKYLWMLSEMLALAGNFLKKTLTGKRVTANKTLQPCIKYWCYIEILSERVHSMKKKVAQCDTTYLHFWNMFFIFTKSASFFQWLGFSPLGTTNDFSNLSAVRTSWEK